MSPILSINVFGGHMIKLTCFSSVHSTNYQQVAKSHSHEEDLIQMGFSLDKGHQLLQTNHFHNSSIFLLSLLYVELFAAKVAMYEVVGTKAYCAIWKW